MAEVDDEPTSPLDLPPDPPRSAERRAPRRSVLARSLVLAGGNSISLQGPGCPDPSLAITGTDTR